jgi:hypothetical protein
MWHVARPYLDDKILFYCAEALKKTRAGSADYRGARSIFARRCITEWEADQPALPDCRPQTPSNKT